MTQLQTTNSNLPATPDDDVNAYLAFGQSLTQQRIIGELLKFTKFGDFVAGENSVLIPHDMPLIAHVPEILSGWQRWQNNKPTDQVMHRIGPGFREIKRDELGDTDEGLWEPDNEGEVRDPWQPTVMMIMKDRGSDRLFTFIATSKGGRQAIGKLVTTWANAIRHRPGQVPVTTRAFDIWKSVKYGETRIPVFNVVDWVPRQEVDDVLNPAAAQATLDLLNAPGGTPGPVEKGAGTTARKTRF
jgi:hypothetical protein